jgi:hypothetical protein
MAERHHRYFGTRSPEAMCTDLLCFLSRRLTKISHRQGWKSIFANKRAQACKSRLVWFIFGRDGQKHSSATKAESSCRGHDSNYTATTYIVSHPYTQASSVEFSRSSYTGGVPTAPHRLSASRRADAGRRRLGPARVRRGDPPSRREPTARPHLCPRHVQVSSSHHKPVPTPSKSTRPSHPPSPTPTPPPPPSRSTQPIHPHAPTLQPTRWAHRKEARARARPGRRGAARAAGGCAAGRRAASACGT